MTCDGFCGNKYHVKCCEFQKSKNTIEAIKKYKSVVFKCEECVDIDHYIKESNMKMFDAIEILNKKFDQLNGQISEKIDKKFVELNQQIIQDVKVTMKEMSEINSEKYKMKWNEIVKQNVPTKTIDPVVIVRPSKSNMKRDDIKKTISQSIDASKYNVNGTKKSVKQQRCNKMS